jgi:hypothetical protein
MTSVDVEDSSWVAVDELEANSDDELDFGEFDILSSPNDWNILTLVNYMDSGAIKIPRFQRNFVWDLKKASKLIESLLMGLPVPQIFLYEEARNSFLVIDGQQRLLSIFFFFKGRFPKPAARGALGLVMKGGNRLDASMLDDDEIFQDFRLNLRRSGDTQASRFHGLKYSQLKEYQSTLDLRTLRNVVVKQVSPAGHASMFEIFNRLNTGGVNLNPQEIRTSLYRSRLMDVILDLNLKESWRELIEKPLPDGRMADVEILVRSAALATQSPYSSPMTSFVNDFCIAAQRWDETRADEVVGRLEIIIQACRLAGSEPFRRQGRFSPSLFESIVVACWNAQDLAMITAARVSALARDAEFVNSLQEGSTKTINVVNRLKAANRVLSSN